jgi:hypothetical protein
MGRIHSAKLVQAPDHVSVHDDNDGLRQLARDRGWFAGEEKARSEPQDGVIQIRRSGALQLRGRDDRGAGGAGHRGAARRRIGVLPNEGRWWKVRRSAPGRKQYDRDEEMVAHARLYGNVQRQIGRLPGVFSQWLSHSGLGPHIGSTRKPRPVLSADR